MFIYVGAMMAHIIPHAQVSEGDLPKFLEELDRRHQSNAALPAPASHPS